MSIRGSLPAVIIVNDDAHPIPVTGGGGGGGVTTVQYLSGGSAVSVDDSSHPLPVAAVTQFVSSGAPTFVTSGNPLPTTSVVTSAPSLTYQSGGSSVPVSSANPLPINFSPPITFIPCGYSHAGSFRPVSDDLTVGSSAPMPVAVEFTNADTSRTLVGPENPLPVDVSAGGTVPVPVSIVSGGSTTQVRSLLCQTYSFITSSVSTTPYVVGPLASGVPAGTKLVSTVRRLATSGTGLSCFAVFEVGYVAVVAGGSAPTGFTILTLANTSGGVLKQFLTVGSGSTTRLELAAADFLNIAASSVEADLEECSGVLPTGHTWDIYGVLYVPSSSIGGGANSVEVLASLFQLV